MEELLTEKGHTVIRHAIGNSSLTNCYLSYNLVIDRIRAQEIRCFCYDGIILMVHSLDGVNKLYYFLESRDVLVPDVVRRIQGELEGYPDLVGTVVSRRPEKNADILEMLGFRPYKQYIRKQTAAESAALCGTVWPVETAAVGDFDDIYPLLQGISDVMTDHLVSKEELHEFLAAKQVLKIVAEGELAGVLVFETFGKKSYLRTVSVADRFIGRKIGFSLIEGYFEKNRENAKLFYLWVESTNERAIRLYDRLGYKDDGLTEYIYRKGQWH